MPAEARVVGDFIALIALIILVSRFLLYQPARSIARRLGLQDRGMGQLLGYLTSVPELVTAVSLAAVGYMTAVAVNVLSSNILNVVLAMGVAAAFGRIRGAWARELRLQRLLIAASVILPAVVLATGSEATPWLVPAYLAMYGAYAVLVYRRHEASPGPDASPGPIDYEPLARVDIGRRLPLSVFLFLNATVIVGALAGLYALGEALAGTVRTLGESFDIPQALIGMVVGFVTSLPELTTFLSAYHAHARRDPRRAPAEVTHNVLASNTANLLLIQSAALTVFLLAGS